MVTDLFAITSGECGSKASKDPAGSWMVSDPPVGKSSIRRRKALTLKAVSPGGIGGNRGGGAEGGGRGGVGGEGYHGGTFGGVGGGAPGGGDGATQENSTSSTAASPLQLDPRATRKLIEVLPERLTSFCRQEFPTLPDLLQTADPPVAAS